MPPDTSGLPPVEFAFTDAEVKAVYAILSRMQARSPAYRSLVSAIIVPLLLMGGLMVWAAVHNLSSNTFGMLIILSIISYLAGHFALRYEILRNARIRALKAYKEDPLLRGTRSLALREDGLAFTTPAMANLYRYTAITKVETSEGFIMVCIGQAAGALMVPVRAFARPAEEEVFMQGLKARVAAAGKA
jgi:hypothetical protein